MIRPKSPAATVGSRYRVPPELRLRPNFLHDDRNRPPRPRPNFVIGLYGRRKIDNSEARCIVNDLNFQPENWRVKGSPVNFNEFMALELVYEQWSEARETMAQLWEIKLGDNELDFFPRLSCNVQVPSDQVELDDRLRRVFMEKLNLMAGELVGKWYGKVRSLLDEIQRFSVLLRKPNSVPVFNELTRRKEGLVKEKELVQKRIYEFEAGVRSIRNYLEYQGRGEGVFPIFEFGNGKMGWDKVYSFIKREFRRLDDGLPIYAYRQDILKQILSQQVTVLIGETGSGKSTQLVQFLADSGVCGQDSIICTQPRKLAAMSLAERVNDESSGCYLVSCHASYSSFQEFESKVIFMTDHCLLRHYMSDKLLSGVSCIIVDEAHERSLNTDLLLALLRDLLCQRPELRLIIMSATADAAQFADYFCGCNTVSVVGRNFPVDIKYVPCESQGFSASKLIPSYVSDVVRIATEIHETKKSGNILAFLTSQTEVEWACEKFQASVKCRASPAIALPLHGKLSFDDQQKVFLTGNRERKVIFATNVAETSLTIPGIKYVVDSGMAKDSKFEPATGMNVLRVCRISKSSANQRSGRAGRTEPGTCYRLYTEDDFGLMTPHQEPEIRKVHLGVAVLRILALGIKNVQSFDFVDSPSVRAIDMAIRNLIQLGAVVVRGDVYELTSEGWEMVKLGIEPRLGKMILRCFRHRLGKEGLVLAAVMANSSSIFCRVGTEEEKLKSDRIKVKFCHPNGDLFTLLSVYKDWEAEPWANRKKWCWDNSINAKSMKRCQDTVREMEACLQNELNMIVPNYWCWNPQRRSEHDRTLQNIILTCLAENVAIYSGYDQLGYEVASSGKHVKLHPSCSLLNFGERPPWVVFSEILSVVNEYLVCVTACNFEFFQKLTPPPVFDYLTMGNVQLQRRILTGFGSVLLKRFCGKFNVNVRHLVSCIKTLCEDERIGVEVNVDQNEISLYASSKDMEKVYGLVNAELEYERKLMKNECLEKCLYSGGPTVPPSTALFGAGGEVKHLELEKRYLTVDVYLSNIDSVNDKELLAFLENNTSGDICGVSKFSYVGQNNEEKEKWGRVTFLTADAAKRAVELKQSDFSGGSLKVVPSRNTLGGDHKMVSVPSVSARISWPRRYSKGVAIAKCEPSDVAFVVDDLSTLTIQGRFVWCGPDTKSDHGVVITGIDRELSEADLVPILRGATTRRIYEVFLLRGYVLEHPPLVACEEAILREISPFMPRRNSHGNFVCVKVFPPEPKDHFMKAEITFDGTLHLEAAKALEHLNGKVLPGCSSWQKVRCQQLFHSSVFCPAAVFPVIRSQLEPLVEMTRRQKGVERCSLEENQNGSCRVKISAYATMTVAELRRPFEQLTKGKILQHPDINPVVLQILYSRDGVMRMKFIQRDTGTHIFFDKHSVTVRIFGPQEKIVIAEQRLVKDLLTLHESKQREIQLRGGALPPDMMKRVVQNFGPDLHGIKEKFPDAEFCLNARWHSISMVGPKELKHKVEAIINDLAQTSSENDENDDACPICLCDVEDSYWLEGCYHEFCRSCLVEQCESAIRSRDTFPLQCTKQGCKTPIYLTDLKTLLSNEELEELFRASLGAFVAGSGGAYRFCPSPDCPSVYQVTDPGNPGKLFVCGACFTETCTSCHLEYHPYLSCEKYLEFKDDPDTSLKEWCMGKENVKSCPVCKFTIEKIEGCNHIECRCGNHVCWVCLEFFGSSDDCYGHLRSVHSAIM